MARQRKTIIHVNQLVVRKNKKTGSRDPVLTVKTGRKNTYASEVEITGKVRVVYRPDKPLSCGATAWLETYGVVEILDKAQSAGLVSTCVSG